MDDLAGVYGGSDSKVPLGLIAAVEWAAEDFQGRTGTECRLSLLDEDIVIDQERATTIFRILQEMLTNIVRHADASQVDIQLSKQDGDIVLKVRDNGRGISQDEISAGTSLGLLGMRERALLLGGELSIGGIPGKGTIVRVWIPEIPITNAHENREFKEPE